MFGWNFTKKCDVHHMKNVKINHSTRWQTPHYIKLAWEMSFNYYFYLNILLLLLLLLLYDLQQRSTSSYVPHELISVKQRDTMTREVWTEPNNPETRQIKKAFLTRFQERGMFYCFIVSEWWFFTAAAAVLVVADQTVRNICGSKSQ